MFALSLQYGDTIARRCKCLLFLYSMVILRDIWTITNASQDQIQVKYS